MNRRERRNAERERRPEAAICPGAGAGAAERPIPANSGLVEEKNARWRALALSVDLAGRCAEVPRAG